MQSPIPTQGRAARVGLQASGLKSVVFFSFSGGGLSAWRAPLCGGGSAAFSWFECG